MKRTFAGSYVALPTPFLGERIDFSCFLRLIEFQIEHGTDGLVIAGTTGEAATLTTSTLAWGELGWRRWSTSTSIAPAG